MQPSFAGSRRGAFEAWLAARPKSLQIPGEAARFMFDSNARETTCRTP